MSDQWQDDLRDRMEIHEEAVPEGLWESIELLMPAENKHRAWSKRMIALAVSAAAIILLFIVLYTTNENQAPIEFVEKNVSIDPGPIPMTADEVPARPGSTPDENSALKRTAGQASASRITAEEKLALNNVSKPPTSVSPKDEAAVAVTDTKEKEAGAKQETTKEEEINRVITNKQPENDLDQLFASSSRGRDRENPKWQTNLSTSNMPSSPVQTRSGYGTFMVQEAVEEQYVFLSQDARQEVNTTVQHFQPVNFGLTFKYNLNEKWSLASGLTYSLLSSRLHSGSGNYHYDDNQRLHYLGIPLNVAYNFWQNNKFAGYISSGMLLEKNIAGSLSSNYYIDNRLESTAKESISSKQLQWSVNSAIGIEYRVSDFMGIYAEPGVAYYFKNSSEIETFYKENPFNFNLRVGLRFSIND
mgnify:CR=1 FL=1